MEIIKENSMTVSGENIAVSIVLPVYNVARFLDKCISCLQSQTLKNIEMIFVDDCGTDNSVEIIEKYAEKDNRIRLVRNNVNMGAGATRNHGIMVATGEYIAFADPDDWMDEDFYERLYNAAKSDAYDVAIGNRVDVIHRSNGEVRYNEPRESYRLIDGCGTGLPLYSCFIHGHQSAIFRMSMVRENSARYSKTSFGECGMFMLTACYDHARYCFVAHANYYYLQHEDSAAHSMSWTKYDNELCAIGEQIAFATEKVSEDVGYIPYVWRKIFFLMWRFRELRTNRKLANMRIEYLSRISDILDMVPNNVRLRRFSPYVSALLDRSYKPILKDAEHSFIVRAERKVRRIIGKVLPSNVKQIIKVLVSKGAYKKINYEDEAIYYMKGYRGTLYFCKRFFDIDASFANEYTKHFSSDAPEKGELNLAGELYKEFRSRLLAGEVCWKFQRRLDCVMESVVFQGSDGSLQIRGDILDHVAPIKKRRITLLSEPPRRIIKGQSLRDYIRAKSPNREEVLGEVRQFLDFVFAKFPGKCEGKVSGKAWDVRPYNCILLPEHKYELFDFEYEYNTDIERWHLLYLALLDVPYEMTDWICYKLCAHYGIVPDREMWFKHSIQDWSEIVAPNVDSKYFQPR